MTSRFSHRVYGWIQPISPVFAYRFSLIAILLSVIASLLSGCAAGVPRTLEGGIGTAKSAAAVQTTPAIVQTAASVTPTKPPGNTPTIPPTNTPTSPATRTPTRTQTITPSPTITRAVDDGRRWTRNQFSRFISFVGGPIMHDPRYPEDDRLIHQTVTSLRSCFGDGDACDVWIYNAYDLTKDKIFPMYWCQWAFDNLTLEYGTHLRDESGNIFQLREIEDAWEQAYILLTNPATEPYCPQFVQNK